MFITASAGVETGSKTLDVWVRRLPRSRDRLLPASLRTARLRTSTQWRASRCRKSGGIARVRCTRTGACGCKGVHHLRGIARDSRRLGFRSRQPRKCATLRADVGASVSTARRFGRTRAAAAGAARAPGRVEGARPYVSERAWGSVREDYSADGTAWDSFPHEHARSRAYRWNEDGLAGVCDLEQRMCLALAFWNGRDPILKERIFGLNGREGNHGEDAKEYWWYADATPTVVVAALALPLSAGGVSLRALRAENARRSQADREFELIDTGVFDDDRYWQIEADLREGRAARPVPAPAHPQRRTRRRRAARAAHAVVPQSLVLGGRDRAPVDPRGDASRGERRGARDRRGRAARPLDAQRGPRSGGPCARPALLRERDEHAALVRRAGQHALSEGRRSTITSCTAPPP